MYEIQTFLLEKLYKQRFLFYTLITMVILHPEFGLIWTTPLIWTIPWPDEKAVYLRFNFRLNRKFLYEKLNFSYTSYRENSFRLTIYLHSRYSIPVLVQFGQLLDPIKNNYF